MAACSPKTLLAQGSAFQALADSGLKMVEAELIREWSGSPTPINTLLSDGKDFQKLSSRDLSIIQAQLLCNISGGT